MAQLCLIGAGVLIWVATYVVTLDDVANARLVQRLALLVPLRLRHLVGTLAASSLVTDLLGIGMLARLSDGFVLRMAADGVTVIREEACALCVLLSSVAALVLAVLTRSVMAVPISFASYAVVLVMWDASCRRKAQQELLAAMPGVFRSLAMAMGSGETLAQAVDYVGAHESGAAGRAFRRASLRLRCGETAENALRSLADELDAPGMGLLVTALLISQRTGSPLRGLFRHSAALVERQGVFERMLAVKTAQVRLSVQIVSLMPVAMVVLLSLLSLDFRQGLMSLPGMACLLVAAAMDVTALIIIRHLMKGVL